MFRQLTTLTSGLRRPGAAALDLAYVAAGRLDGFFEIGLSAWDIAAGGLLVTEAGGLIGDFRGEPGYLESGDVLAGTPKIFAQLVTQIGPLRVPVAVAPKDKEPGVIQAAPKKGAAVRPSVARAPGVKAAGTRVTAAVPRRRTPPAR
jgi:hypothetical protein